MFRITTRPGVGLCHLHLTADLERHLRPQNPPATMTSTLAELSVLEITPSSSKLGAKEPCSQRRKTKRIRDLSQIEPFPAKFLNRPPEPLYYFKNGLRKVPPYNYTYNTYCKERWRGRTLLDIFVKEFRDRSEEYYVRAPVEILHKSIQAELGPPCHRKKPSRQEQSQYLEGRTAKTLHQNSWFPAALVRLSIMAT